MNLTFDTNGNEKQKEACRAWIDDTIEVVAYGGAKYGGKSYLGGELIFGDALTYPGTHYFIGRENLNDLRKYTIPTIHEVFDSWGLEVNDYARYNGQDSYYQLNNGSRVYLIDMAHQPRDPDYHRFGSINMTRGWIEEIGQCKTKAIEMLSLTVGRWKNKEYKLKPKVLMTMNPNKGYGYHNFYLPHKSGNLPKNIAFIKALPTDNKAGDQDYIQSILNHPNKNIRERLGLGNWEYDDDPSALVGIEDISDLWTNTHVAKGTMSITADIAFLGSDKFCIGIWSGWQLIEVYSIAKSDPKEVETTIKTLAEKHGVKRSRIVYDSDGIGSFLDSYLKGAKAFKNNGKPIGRDNYANLKSQCGYGLAKKITDGDLHIVPTEYQEGITRELEQLKSYNTDKDGKLQTLPKAKIIELIGHSPDFMDMLFMRYLLELTGGSIKSSHPIR